MHRHRDQTPRKRSYSWATRVLLGGIVVVFAVQLVDHLTRVHTQLDRLESSRRNQATVFRQGLTGVQDQLASIRREVENNIGEVQAASDLATRLRDAENLLGDIGLAVEAHASSLTELAESQENLPSFQAEIEQRQEKWDELTTLVSSAQETAHETLKEVERLDNELLVNRDLDKMWRELVGPVVQLSGESSVGSGVLLPSEWSPHSGRYRSFLITAWHVVRDIQGDLSNSTMPVPVNIYSQDGSIRHEEARLLIFDADLDSALLELETADALKNGATLASPERLSKVRIFDRIYAVGCPLGNDPIPTPGEMATCNHVVEGSNYWMINAPTYIGNSGGGIFDSQTHELMGIFSKIYTHGSLRPTIVPHMGLVTPMSSIYSWLEEEGYATIIPGVRNASGPR